MRNRWSMAWALCVIGVVAIPAVQAATLEGDVRVWEQGLLFGERELDDRSHAVIFVAGFSEPAPTDRQLALVQQDKSFSERVLAITQGEVVVFPNKDPFHHNVWSKSKARPFDLGLYKFPESRTVAFPNPGVVTVFCNIHPQMIATILVLPNRRYAVTPESGRYRIGGIPAGTHAVFAWVEGAEPVRQVLTFADGQAVRADFRLRLSRIPLEHLNKDGQAYKKNGAPYR